MASYKLCLQQGKSLPVLWYEVIESKKDFKMWGRIGIDLTNALYASIVEFEIRYESIRKYIFTIAVAYKSGITLYKFIDHFKYGNRLYVIMQVPNTTEYKTDNPRLEIL